MSNIFQRAYKEAYVHENPNTNRHKPQIARVSRSDPLPAIIDHLEVDGAVIVRDFTDVQTVERSMEEVRPWLDKQSDGQRVGGKSKRRTYPFIRLIQGWRVGHAADT
jgi:hypothetical protein